MIVSMIIAGATATTTKKRTATQGRTTQEAPCLNEQRYSVHRSLVYTIPWCHKRSMIIY